MPIGGMPWIPYGPCGGPWPPAMGECNCITVFWICCCVGGIWPAAEDATTCYINYISDYFRYIVKISRARFFPNVLNDDNVFTCGMTGGSDGNVRFTRRSLTAGNSEHSDWLAPYSANLFSCRDAAAVAEAGLGSLFSASCVRFVVTSYTNGNTKDGGSPWTPILVICNCEIYTGTVRKRRVCDKDRPKLRSTRNVNECKRKHIIILTKNKILFLQTSTPAMPVGTIGAAEGGIRKHHCTVHLNCCCGIRLGNRSSFIICTKSFNTLKGTFSILPKPDSVLGL